jgi:hypothetical protein
LSLVVLQRVRGLTVAGDRCAASISTTLSSPTAATAASASSSTIHLRAALAPKEAKVCNVDIQGLGRGAVSTICHLQLADIHAVELHVRLAIEGNLLLCWHIEVLDLGVSCALDVKLDDLG